MLERIKIKTINESQKKTLQNRVMIGLFLFLFWVVLSTVSLISSTNILERIFGNVGNIATATKIAQLVCSIFVLLLLLPLILISYYEINKIYFDKISSITYLNRFEKSFANLIKISTIKNRQSYLILTSALLSSFLVASISLIVRTSVISFQENNTAINNDLSVILFVSMIVAFMIWAIASFVILRKFKVDNFRDIFTFLLITFITNAGFISFFYIAINQGFAVLVFLFFVVASSDTFAYLGGMFFGKRKLSPKISPNKTIEGFLIGFVSSVALSMALSGFFYYIDTITYDIEEPLLSNGQGLLDSIVFGMYSKKPLFTDPIVINDPAVKDAVTFVSIFVLSMLISIVSSMGDIFFSYIKRSHEIKDYSNILKDHGGILDRFDSVLFSSTFYIGCFFIVLVFLQFIK